MAEFLTDIESAKRKTITGLIGLVALFTLFEYFRPPSLGHALRGEWNLWTVGIATLLFLVAFLALICAGMSYYMRHRQITQDRIWVAWLLVAAAFQYSVLDETLQFHERIGAIILHSKPHLVRFRPHNWVEACYYAGALVLTLAILEKVRHNRQFFRFYAGGIGLMTVQTLLGVLPTSIAWPIYDRLPPAFPELLEISAVTCFACGFLVLVFEYVQQISRWLIHSALEEHEAAEHVLSFHNGG